MLKYSYFQQMKDDAEMFLYPTGGRTKYSCSQRKRALENASSCREKAKDIAVPSRSGRQKIPLPSWGEVR
jgi:hypothetical protein